MRQYLPAYFTIKIGETMSRTRYLRHRGVLYRRMLRKTINKTVGQVQKLADKHQNINEITALKKQLRLLHEYSNDVVYRLRYDNMRYEFISPNVKKLLGYSADEIQQLSIRSLILETRMIEDGMRKIQNFQQLEQYRKEGKVKKWQADYQMQTKDGKKIWVSDISYPWTDQNGYLIGSVGALRDITSRVNAETVMREELVRLANIDTLTGLYNRRVFFEKLEHEIKRQRRAREDMALCIIDVDHFKKINDIHGYYAGDQLLAQLAMVIQSCLRETDIAARLGGEEFGLLLPDTSADGAYWVAERVREKVACHNFVVGENKVAIGCTVSVGIAGLPVEESITATEIYKLADTRLYIAKHTGRNQVSADEVLSLH